MLPKACFIWLVLTYVSWAEASDDTEDPLSNLHHSAKNKELIHRVKREWIWNRMNIHENNELPFPHKVGTIRSNAAINKSVSYSITGEGAGTIFKVNAETGDVYAYKTLNREEKAEYKLLAKVLDKKTGKELDPASAFTIQVNDVNDNAPIFTKNVYQATIPEMSKAGTTVIQVTAVDADDPTVWKHATVAYSLLNGTEYFRIDQTTGQITTKSEDLDRETTPSYMIIVEARDLPESTGGYMSSTATLIITLSDINDNMPVFHQGSFDCIVQENHRIGSEVCRLKADDPDEPQNVNTLYRFVKEQITGTFNIITDPVTKEGKIITTKALDYEKQRTYTFSVEAIDTDVNMYTKKTLSSAKVTINVQDVDEPPVFTLPSKPIQVYENASRNYVVGGVCTKDLFCAEDPDTAKKAIRYSIASKQGTDDVFRITESGMIVLIQSLDRETNAWQNITVLAQEFEKSNNKLGLSSSAVIAVQVLDVNDNAPKFASQYEPYVCEKDEKGKLIQMISAIDKDEMTPGVNFQFFLPSNERNFTVEDNHDNTANITLQHGDFKHETVAKYLLPVIISDNGNPQQTSTNTLTIKVCKCDTEGYCYQFAASKTGVGIHAVIAILLCIVTIIVITLLIALHRKHRKDAIDGLGKSIGDIHEQLVTYDEEGGGEMDTNSYDVSVLNSVRKNGVRPTQLAQPDFNLYSQVQKPTGSGEMAIMIEVKKDEADHDKDGIPYDTLHIYDYEGSDSVAESLSSLQTWSLDSDQDYDCLNDWGPRFKMLADLYGLQHMEDDLEY